MSYDVVIIGGGAAGCSAAYNFGINGFKTLLVEKNTFLGGLMTGGLVTPFMKTSRNQINTSFLTEFKDELSKLNGIITYSDGNDGWFNPELAKIALDTLMSKSGVEVLFNTEIASVNIVNKVICGVTLSSNMLSEYIETRYVIDATGNCDFGKLCDCTFLNNENEQQPTTLRFLMGNVNVDDFAEWITGIDSDENVTTVCKINNQTHLSTAYTWDKSMQWALKPYFDEAVANKELKDTDRNYFQLFTVPDMPNSIAFNAPRIYFDKNINPLNVHEASLALKLGRESIYRLSKFCKKYFKGFENAYISNIASMLGIRVSRRMKGKYIYTINDLRSGRKFNNPVLISNYPVDVHSTNNNSILEKVDVEYQVPVEALISCEIENLYVAGRCISADFLSQGALRIIPSCFSMGEGLAKYLLEL